MFSGPRILASFSHRVLTCRPNNLERTFKLYWIFALAQAYAIANLSVYAGIDQHLAVLVGVRADDAPKKLLVHALTAGILSVRLLYHQLKPKVWGKNVEGRTHDACGVQFEISPNKERGFAKCPRPGCRQHVPVLRPGKVCSPLSPSTYCCTLLS